MQTEARETLLSLLDQISDDSFESVYQEVSNVVSTSPATIAESGGTAGMAHIPDEITPATFPAVVASWGEIWANFTDDERMDMIFLAVSRTAHNRNLATGVYAKIATKPEPVTEYAPVDLIKFSCACISYLLRRLNLVDQAVLRAMMNADYANLYWDKLTPDSQKEALEDVARDKKLLARAKKHRARRRA
jgi:hypothetical protein